MLVILVALVIGVFLGVAVMLPLWLRAKKLTPPGTPRHSVLASTTFDADSTLLPPEANDRRHGL